MVYHRGCGKKTLAAAAITVEDDRDVLVERPDPTRADPVNPSATGQEPTTTPVDSPEGGESRPTVVGRTTEDTPACVRRASVCMNVYARAYTYIHMGTYVLVAERRRLAADAADSRQRAATCHEPTTTVVSRPTVVNQQPTAPAWVWPTCICIYVHVYVYVYIYMCEYVLAAHVAESRRRAVNAAETRRRADRPAATGCPANPATRIASVRVEGDREILVAERRRQRAVVRAAKRRRRAANAAERRQRGNPANREQPTV